MTLHPSLLRQIIALDLDNFYVGCERLRDPSLVGKPVGIKQKGILATCSYEARAQGVGKLMGVSEAVKRCPELVIVLGEDLTPYRHHSGLVFNRVRSLLGPSCPVEKLGMDELFADVTSLISTHLDELKDGSVRRREDGRTWFRLAGEENAGFWYDESNWAGHRLEDEARLGLEGPQHLSSPVASSSGPSTPSRYLIASHLALHLRTQIQDVIGLSSSAGVSHTKCLSKLIASVHKPADQTSLNPTFGHPASSPPVISSTTSKLIQSFLDPLPLRNLPGFGHAVGAKINQVLGALPSPPSDADAPSVETTRARLNLNTFKTIATARLAPILWALLHGDDPSPVIASPDFPAQISVEDSYASKHTFTWKRFGVEVERLLTSLLVRLEEELVVVDAVGGKRRWVRWPKKLRLELRRGWDGMGREGRSVDMPVGVFELENSVEARVGLLMGRKAGSGSGGDPVKVGGVAGSLMRALVKEAEGTKFDLYIISFAAVTLSTSPPGPSIERWTNPSSANSSSVKGKQKGLDLDLSVLEALPADLRAEVLSSYGLSERDVTRLLDESRPAKRARPSDTAPSEPDITSSEPARASQDQAHTDPTAVEDSHHSRPDRGHPHHEEPDEQRGPPDYEHENSEDDGGGDDEMGVEETQPCPVCGLDLYPFAAAAHALYHDNNA